MKAYTFSSIHKIQTFSEGNPDTRIYICETIHTSTGVLSSSCTFLLLVFTILKYHEENRSKIIHIMHLKKKTYQFPSNAY